MHRKAFISSDTVSQCAFPVVTAILWYELPGDIIVAHSLTVCRRQMKTVLRRQSVMVWSCSSRVASLDRNQTTQQHFFSHYLRVCMFTKYSHIIDNIYIVHSVLISPSDSSSSLPEFEFWNSASVLTFSSQVLWLHPCALPLLP